MDFELTKEQLDIKRAAREFAEAEFEKDRVLELGAGELVVASHSA